jgi:glycosyltransferase involved in cell wall biosynthesis
MAIATLEGVAETNVSVSARIDVGSRRACCAGILARYHGPGDGGAYLALLVANDGRHSADLWRHAGDGWSLIRSVPIQTASGLLGLQVFESTLALYLDGILLHRVEDQAITGPGSVGLRAQGGRIDSFRAERLTASPPDIWLRALPGGTVHCRPLHVGIWCDFGPFISRDAIRDLATTLLNHPEPIDVTLVVPEGDDKAIVELPALTPGRVRVVRRVGSLPKFRRWLFQALCWWIQGSFRIRRDLWTRLGIRGPFAWLGRLTCRLLLGRRLAGAAPYREVMELAGCEAWLIPYGGFEFTFPIDTPAVVFIPELVAERLSELLDLGFIANTNGIIPSLAAETTLWACTSESVYRSGVNALFGLPADRMRLVRCATGPDVPVEFPAAADWHAVMREAIARFAVHGRARPREREKRPAAPSPFAPKLDGRRRILLFLAWYSAGGVWQAVKDLVVELAAINRERRQLDLVLGLHPDCFDNRDIGELREALPLVPVEMQPLPEKDKVDLLAGEAAAPRGLRGPSCFFVDDEGEATALGADAWVALTDRFELPLLPIRPYGVFVYDMIQRHFPEGFPEAFHRMRATGMGPTLRAARQILVTSPATERDVEAEYGIAAAQVRVIPVACEPHQRFGALVPVPVELPSSRFILNVTNASPHKGAATLLRAHGRLKAMWGDACPMLVMCGWRTECFRPASDPDGCHAHHLEMRSLVTELGLREGRDVVFLGYVDDPQLLDLYQHCAVVVNAAKYDNGSFSLVEARYFGKPTVSTRYPACEFLCERFGLPVRFFPVDDDAWLAEVLQEALRETPITGAALDAIRASLADPRLGYRRYAEGVYEALVELAGCAQEPTSRIDRVAA